MGGGGGGGGGRFIIRGDWIRGCQVYTVGLEGIRVFFLLIWSG